MLRGGFVSAETGKIERTVLGVFLKLRCTSQQDIDPLLQQHSDGKNTHFVNVLSFPHYFQKSKVEVP